MRMLRAIFALLAFSVIAHAQIISDEGVFTTTSAVPACSQGTAVLARMTGLSGSQTTAYTDLVCGLVTDGIITGNMGTTGCGSVLDALYFFPTANTTNANLNLCGTSFGLTQTGSVTFSTANGYTPDGTTGFFSTGYVPSTLGSTCGNGAAACNYSINSASVGTYTRTSRTISNTTTIIGSIQVSNNVQMLLYYTTGANRINNATSWAGAGTNAWGVSIMTRTATAASAYYKYQSGGNSSVTNAGSSTSLPSVQLYIGARNNAGTADAFAPDNITAAFMGGALNATQAGQIATRLNQAMTDLGINVY